MGSVPWQVAEQHIKNRQADILLVFDCCWAGLLSGPYERAPPSKRHFEFLGACAANQVTAGPGPKSFTRAMIESLKDLADEEGGFTTSMLYTKIMNHQNFPKHKQSPTHASRTDSRNKMLLSPLKKAEPLLSPPPDVGLESQLDYCLTLDFLFDDIPDESQFKEICNSFKNIFESGPSVFKKIEWRSMHKRKVTPEILVRQVAEIWRQRTLIAIGKKRKLSQDHELSQPCLAGRRNLAQFEGPGRVRTT